MKLLAMVLPRVMLNYFDNNLIEIYHNVCEKGGKVFYLRKLLNFVKGTWRREKSNAGLC